MRDDAPRRAGPRAAPGRRTRCRRRARGRPASRTVHRASVIDAPPTPSTWSGRSGAPVASSPEVGGHPPVGAAGRVDRGVRPQVDAARGPRRPAPSPAASTQPEPGRAVDAERGQRGGELDAGAIGRPARRLAVRAATGSSPPAAEGAQRRHRLLAGQRRLGDRARGGRATASTVQSGRRSVRARPGLGTSRRVDRHVDRRSAAREGEPTPGPGLLPGARVVLRHAGSGGAQAACVTGVGRPLAGGTSSCMTDVRRLETVTATTMTTTATDRDRRSAAARACSRRWTAGRSPAR